jgi:hypothetical protein
MTPDYAPPVAQLLTLGVPQEFHAENWINYPAQFGLTLDHVPDLIQLTATWDEDKLFDDDVDPAIYAPIHAGRALGQLRAEEAIDTLIALSKLSNDEPDDWVAEELPEILGLIGPAAMPALTTFATDSGQGIWPRVTVGSTFVYLVKRYPDQRSLAIAALSAALADFANNDPELNGFLVCYLLDLEAVEAAPTMEQAFAAKAVDVAFAGDWHDVQVTLGLKERPAVLPRRSLLEPPGALMASGVELGDGTSKANHKSKARAKNKLAKQSRQKNRKKRK